MLSLSIHYYTLVDIEVYTNNEHKRKKHENMKEEFLKMLIDKMFKNNLVHNAMYLTSVYSHLTRFIDF